MSFFEAEQWIPVDLETVFRFFSNPENLPSIMPAQLQARVLLIDLVGPPSPTPLPSAAGPGTRITFSFRPVPFLPIRQKWIAEILEFEYLSYFRDRQAKGPFKSWDHRHEFEASTRNGTQGTIIRDRVKFEVGYGWIGKLVERAFLVRQMSATFAHRQAELERIFGLAPKPVST